MNSLDLSSDSSRFSAPFYAEFRPKLFAFLDQVAFYFLPAPFTSELVPEVHDPLQLPQPAPERKPIEPRSSRAFDSGAAAADPPSAAPPPPAQALASGSGTDAHQAEEPTVRIPWYHSALCLRLVSEKLL